VFPVRYELDSYIFLRRNSVLKGLMQFSLLLVCTCVSSVNNYVVSCVGVFATNDEQ
jgi:hypothetical protein